MLAGATGANIRYPNQYVGRNGQHELYIESYGNWYLTQTFLILKICESYCV
jgi:hypothetical protein